MPTFRHTAIRHLEIGRFKFEDYILRTETEEGAEEFRALAEKMPAAYRNGIVEIDESVVSTKPLKSPTAKSVLTSDVLKTQQVEQPVAMTSESVTTHSQDVPVVPVVTTKEARGATVAERVAAAKRG